MTDGTRSQSKPEGRGHEWQWALRANEGLWGVNEGVGGQMGNKGGQLGAPGGNWGAGGGGRGRGTKPSLHPPT